MTKYEKAPCERAQSARMLLRELTKSVITGIEMRTNNTCGNSNQSNHNSNDEMRRCIADNGDDNKIKLQTNKPPLPCNDMILEPWAWMTFKKKGGLGVGAAVPPFANKMICTTFPYCKHGDGMYFSRKHGRPQKSEGGMGGRNSPICNQHDPHNLPFLHADDMML